MVRREYTATPRWSWESRHWKWAREATERSQVSHLGSVVRKQLAGLVPQIYIRTLLLMDSGHLWGRWVPSRTVHHHPIPTLRGCWMSSGHVPFTQYSAQECSFHFRSTHHICFFPVAVGPCFSVSSALTRTVVSRFCKESVRLLKTCV